MQFFEHQDQARSRTKLLVVLFAAAVLALGLLSALAAHLVLSSGSHPSPSLSKGHWSLVATAAIITWGIIGLGSLVRLGQLSRGGKDIAETLGGLLISPNTNDPLERRAANVVEEMAIAAGLPVPPLYLLRNEPGINAFAAGWSPDDAVVGLTQGALEGLTRDQLQGVIAHEFSHILNQDCALNMRLVGVLHGIVVVSSIGRMVMRLSSGSRHTSTRKVGGSAQFFFLGAAIWAFGSLGVLLARLIQAAVSQQREFLADASAVQFTRNPVGIAGALATIATQSSSLVAPRAREASHMLIGAPGTTSSFLGVLSSHPPLFERVSRILPSWNGEFSALATPPGSVREALATASAELDQLDYIPGFPGLSQLASGHAPGMTDHASRLVPSEATLILEPVVALAHSAPHPPSGVDALGRARVVLSQLPTRLREAAQSPFSARALIVALVQQRASGPSDAGRDEETASSDRGASSSGQRHPGRNDRSLWSEVSRLRPLLDSLPPDARMPLLDIALGSLAALSLEQREQLDAELARLQAGLPPRAYGAYCLLSVTRRHLDVAPLDRPNSRLLIKDAIEIALSVLSYEGHHEPRRARAAFEAGITMLGKRGHHLSLCAPEELHVTRLDAALGTLLRLPKTTRAALLDTAEAIAQNDGVLKPSEAELLRTLALSLHLAVPPEAPRRPIHPR